MKKVLTYGTYDLLHYGHIRLIKRARALGDHLTVALSTDEFNLEQKGKKTYHSYDVRREMLLSLCDVDEVIPERNWNQKIKDVKDNDIDVVVMGGDWAGSDRFEYLADVCELVFLDRTEGISTTQIKDELKLLSPEDDHSVLPQPAFEPEYRSVEALSAELASAQRTLKQKNKIIDAAQIACNRYEEDINYLRSRNEALKSIKTALVFAVRRMVPKSYRARLRKYVKR